MNTWLKDLESLSAAEEFLDYFGIPYEMSVVHVNRLHILKRFHDYLRRQPGADLDAADLRAHYQACLALAYQDFVRSDASTEKVFKVFRDAAGQSYVSIESLRQTLPSVDRIRDPAPGDHHAQV